MDSYWKVSLWVICLLAIILSPCYCITHSVTLFLVTKCHMTLKHWNECSSCMILTWKVCRKFGYKFQDITVPNAIINKFRERGTSLHKKEPYQKVWGLTEGKLNEIVLGLTFTFKISLAPHKEDYCLRFWVLIFLQIKKETSICECGHSNWVTRMLV
jgi:hypothetical protein